jgi:hypothetical protein
VFTWGAGTLVPDEPDEVELDELDDWERPGSTVRQSTSSLLAPSDSLSPSRVPVVDPPVVRDDEFVVVFAVVPVCALADELWPSCQAITPPSATAITTLSAAATRRARQARGRRGP